MMESVYGSKPTTPKKILKLVLDPKSHDCWL